VDSSRELNGPSWSQEPLAPLGAPRFSNRRSGSGSFGLPRVPHDLLAVTNQGLQGLPVTLAALGRSLGTTAIMALSSPSERSLERWNPLSAIPPLMGFECLPPVGIPPCVHSQEPRLPSDQRCHTPILVPPSWFRATSMVCSALELRVCCTPQPTKGSPRFMRAARPCRPEATRTDGDNSRDAVHTLRRLPLISSRTHITVAVAFLPLPSCPISHIRPRPDGSPTAAHRGARRTPCRSCPGRLSATPRGARVLTTWWEWRRASEEVGLQSRGNPIIRRVQDSVGWGARGSEELRVPCPVGWGARGSEELRVPCPVGWGAPHSEERGVPCPVRPTRIAPRSVTCRDPARCAARHSEERRVPHPVDRGRASRRGPTVENRAPCLRRGRSPCSVRSRAPYLRRGRSLCSIEADVRCSEECRSPPRVDLPARAVTGVRGRDPDAVMLRSAEANPHVTDHASLPGAEAPDISA